MSALFQKRTLDEVPNLLFSNQTLPRLRIMKDL